MQIATPWELIDLTSTERMLGGLVELAVLAAAPGGPERLLSVGVQRAARRLAAAGQEGALDAFLESLRAGSRKDDRWRRDLADAMDGVTESRLRAILADLCVESGLVDIRREGGPVTRRLDAVLDLAQVPFAVADVQAAYADLAGELAAASGEPGYAGAELGPCARLLVAVLGAVDCELPSVCDVLAVRAELAAHVAAACGPRGRVLTWASDFVAGTLEEKAPRLES